MMLPPEYDIVVDRRDLLSSLLPYAVHIVMVVLQAVVAIGLFCWAAATFNVKNKGVIRTPRLRVINSSFMQTRGGGIVFLLSGLLLLSPLAFGWHHLISGIVLILVILFLLGSDWKVSFWSGTRRWFVCFSAVLTLLFLLWENADPAQYGTYLCFKALDWRIVETDWQKNHDTKAPKVGQLAPDFSLISTDARDTFRLSDYRNKRPVALIFGSHTCPPHSDGSVTTNELYSKYKDKVVFAHIYISEAHPVEKWWLAESKTQKAIYKWSEALARTDVKTPLTLTERNELAKTYREALFNNKLPVYVDGMENQVSALYAGKPTRIYFIGANGKVVYNPGFGPASYNTKHLGNEIEKYLNNTK